MYTPSFLQFFPYFLQSSLKWPFHENAIFAVKYSENLALLIFGDPSVNVSTRHDEYA
jgi:hypothetical protein